MRALSFLLFVNFSVILLQSVVGTKVSLRELDSVISKEKEDIKETPAWESHLDKLLQEVREIKNNLKTDVNITKLERMNRAALSGCQLIPTDLPRHMPSYFFCDKLLNWYMADQYCKLHGMYLISFDNKATFDSVTRYLTNFMGQIGVTNCEFYTGGTDLGNERNWYWAPTGKLFTWTNWLPNQPDNRANVEHCLSLWKGGNSVTQAPVMGFNDFDCNLKLRFVCQLD